VESTTSSCTGVLPPTSPVLPPCARAGAAVGRRRARRGLQARGGARACGTTASMRALQCARMRDTCSVLLGRSATLQLPAYLPIQSLRGRAGAARAGRRPRRRAA